MRITNQMMADNVTKNVQVTLNQLNKTQEQVSSGKKFTTPSDDPTDASQSLQLKSSLSVSEGYQDTSALIEDWMSETDFCLSELVDIANRASTTILSGLSDTLDDNARTTLATELTAMIDQAVDLGNTKYQGNYIFSGVKLDTPAFILTDPSTLTYQGISKAMERSIAPGSEITMNVNGNEAISPLIEAMIYARDNLITYDADNLSAASDQLTSALDTLSTSQTANGARLRQIEAHINKMEESDINIEALLSKKEDTDLVEAAAILKSQETAYQVVLEVGNRALSALNLFDYLQ